MLTIDLLKGTAVPIKNSPGAVALKVLPFVLPLVVAVYLAGSFQFNRTVIASEQASIDKIQEKMSEYAADIQQTRQWKNATQQTRSNLAEVTRGLRRHAQWSPVLQAIVECMPDSVALKEVKLNRNAIRKQSVDPKESEKQVHKTIINRMLTIQLSGDPSIQTDEAVRHYLDRLGQSPAVRPRMKDIRIVSQQTSELNGKTAIVYTVECELQAQE
jgi:hypothetical protein